MKKALLASTALVGAALLSAPAQAGTVGAGDNLEVRLSGFMFFQAAFLDEDRQTGFGRGYRFSIPETEIHVNASNTARKIDLQLGGHAGDRPRLIGGLSRYSSIFGRQCAEPPAKPITG